jgi:hypothetical protein
MKSLLRAIEAKPSLVRLIISSWLTSLLLTILTLFTRLEFSPLPLGNIPRWIVWGLAFPACYLLRLHNHRLRWLWMMIPWLLWAFLICMQGLAVWVSFHQVGSYTFWEGMLEPPRFAFANQERWIKQRVIFRRGSQVIEHQYLYEKPMGILDVRQAIITPILPGLQWATRLPIAGQGVVDASWQLVDSTSVEMSQDTALNRRLKPWLLKHPAF